MIPVSFFSMFLLWINWEKCPGDGVLARFLGPRVGVLNSFFAWRVGNSPIKKIAGGFAQGGMVRLGGDWYIRVASIIFKDSYKFINLPLLINTKIICFSKWATKRFFPSLFKLRKKISIILVLVCPVENTLVMKWVKKKGCVSTVGITLKINVCYQAILKMVNCMFKKGNEKILLWRLQSLATAFSCFNESILSELEQGRRYCLTSIYHIGRFHHPTPNW